MARVKSKTTDTQENVTDSVESRSAVVSVLSSSLVDGLEAFYAGKYEEAIARLEAVLHDASCDEDAKAKAAYWRAEALLQREYSRDSVVHFERVAEEYATHYLGAAARRRVEALKAYFAVFTTESSP